MNSRRLWACAAVLAFLSVSAAGAQTTLLPREKIVLKSAISVDPASKTAVLPLHKGRVAGSPVVYNMPIVATGDGPFDVTTHTNTQDRVIAIDTSAAT